MEDNKPKSPVVLEFKEPANSLLPQEEPRKDTLTVEGHKYKENIINADDFEEFVPPDGGRGWLVCLASFWVNGVVFGMLNTFGILLPHLSQLADTEENVTTKVSLIASITLFMTFFTSMISSIAADQLGIRKVAVAGALLSFTGLLSSSFVKSLSVLYLTYGVMFGTGSSFIYSGSLVILGHYFKKRMSLVNGIVTTGSAIFTIVLPFLIKYLLENKGLAFTLQIESGLVATTIFCGLVFKPLIKQNDNSKKDANRQYSARAFLSTESIQQAYDDATKKVTKCWAFLKRYLNVDIWKNKGYIIWAIGVTFALFGYFIPLVHINNYVRQRFPEKNGEILIMTIGGVSGVGRLVSGKLGDMACVNRVRFQQVAIVLFGAATLTIPLIPVFEGLIGVCILLGIMDGCFICLLGPIVFDLVGAQNASQAMGFLLAMISIPLMTGPMIGGWIYDETSNYNYAFYFAGVPPMIGATIMFFLPKINSNTDKSGTQADAFASISQWSLHHPAVPGRHQHSGVNVANAPLLHSQTNDTPAVLSSSEELNDDVENKLANSNTLKL